MKCLSLQSLPSFQSICCFACWPKELKLKLHGQPRHFWVLHSSPREMGQAAQIETAAERIGPSLELPEGYGFDLVLEFDGRLPDESEDSLCMALIRSLSPLGRHLTGLGLYAWRVSANLLNAVLQYLPKVHSLHFYRSTDIIPDSWAKLLAFKALKSLSFGAGVKGLTVDRIVEYAQTSYSRRKLQIEICEGRFTSDDMDVIDCLGPGLLERREKLGLKPIKFVMKRDD